MLLLDDLYQRFVWNTDKYFCRCDDWKTAQVEWLIDHMSSKWVTLCVSVQDTATQAIYISLPVYPTLNHHFELVCHNSITISSWSSTFNHHLLSDGPTHSFQVWIFIREPIPKPSDRFPSKGLDFKWVLATWAEDYYWNSICNTTANSTHWCWVPGWLYNLHYIVT